MQDLNKSLYADKLLNNWASRSGLIQAEQYLFEKYLVNRDAAVLEAGTAGGRLVFELEKMGFTNISAFDYVPQMIHQANIKAKKTGSSVKFSVADAKDLACYADHSFDYLIYLQQILSFISDEADFRNAIQETYRTAKKDAVVLFSFLDFAGRRINPYLSFAANLLRKLRGMPTHKQLLPWLKINQKPNWKLLHKNQAVNYWVQKDDVVEMLKETGFTIIEVTHTNKIALTPKKVSKPKGRLYIVCKK